LDKKTLQKGKGEGPKGAVKGRGVKRMEESRRNQWIRVSVGVLILKGRKKKKPSARNKLLI